MNASSRNLLLSNGATLAAALLLHWDVGWLLWPYWIQSVIIGWYARKRMLTLARFSTDGFTSNDQPVPETEQGKRSTANFFALHYGGFHAGYCAFLVAGHAVGELRDILVLVACGVSFVLSQRETYAAQHRADVRGKPNLGALMFTPYLRVVPMHLAIILGGNASGGFALCLFTGLKTVSDLLLDRIDRRMAVRAADRTESSMVAATIPRTVADAAAREGTGA
ncbi:DUF6498-containing protein [Cognatiluteimonas telluris]|jgi:hypothetical protein|uniref:DUF6498-containing protein n=1 Tax=Cognatiluteimonas telluris TaxID=1104775 RepID=UPI00140BA9B3|nr:DUF6498-containing protein [Lysobacter telluris]